MYSESILTVGKSRTCQDLSMTCDVWLQQKKYRLGKSFPR